MSLKHGRCFSKNKPFTNSIPDTEQHPLLISVCVTLRLEAHSFLNLSFVCFGLDFDFQYFHMYCFSHFCHLLFVSLQGKETPSRINEKVMEDSCTLQSS